MRTGKRRIGRASLFATLMLLSILQQAFANGIGIDIFVLGSRLHVVPKDDRPCVIKVSPGQGYWLDTEGSFLDQKVQVHAFYDLQERARQIEIELPWSSLPRITEYFNGVLGTPTLDTAPGTNSGLTAWEAPSRETTVTLRYMPDQQRVKLILLWIEPGSREHPIYVG